MVAAGTDVDADLARSSAVKRSEDLVVHCHEAAEDPTRRIELEREPALGEVHLHARRAGIQGSPDIRFGFVDQISEEGIAGVPGYLLRRIQQAQGEAEITACLIGRCV